MLGRIAFVDAGSPIIIPVNYVLDGASVVLRSAAGTKLDSSERGRPLAFEVDDHDPVARTGWSVLVTGTADAISGSEAEHLADVPEAWALGDREDARLLRLRPDAVTGRRITATPPGQRAT